MSDYATSFAGEKIWRRPAEHFLAAAKVLAVQLLEADRTKQPSAIDFVAGCSSGCRLLLATAIENALKAAIVSGMEGAPLNGGRVDFGKISPGWKSHDLVKMACELKMPLTASEEEYLTGMSEAARWSARFWMPNDVATWEEVKGKGRGVRLPDDIELAEAIMDKARKLSERRGSA